MTEKKANEIFRTKYPDGEICKKNSTSAGGKYWVTFKPNGKVYYYSCASYAELLGRFDFNVVYKHDLVSAEETLRAYKKQLEKAKNGKFPTFAFVFVERTPETERAEINDLQKHVDEYTELVRYYKEDCIIE